MPSVVADFCIFNSRGVGSLRLINYVSVKSGPLVNLCLPRPTVYQSNGLTRPIRNRHSVLHGHCVRVNGLFPCDAFESCKHATVFVLVNLECNTALFPGVVP